MLELLRSKKVRCQLCGWLDERVHMSYLRDISLLNEDTQPLELLVGLSVAPHLSVFLLSI